MNAILIILSYGARYEIPIFTAEQANAYLNEYNGDNGYCYLYTGPWASQELKDLADGVLDSTKEFRNFITSEREEWVKNIEDPKVPTFAHHINDFYLKSVFAY